MSNNGTLLDAWSAFEKSNQKYISLHQTALFRFTVPGMVGRKPSKVRLTNKGIAATVESLASIPITADIADGLREAQKRVFEQLNTSKKRQRQPRYYLNEFIDWSITNKIFPSTYSHEEKPQKYVFYSDKLAYIKSTNRQENDKFIFSFEVSDYKDEELQTKEVEHHLQRIEQEFTDFKKYLISTQENREASAKIHEKNLKRILGWFYKTGKSKLADISLSKLVPFIRFNFRLKEFSSRAKKDSNFSKINAEIKSLEDVRDEVNDLVTPLLTQMITKIKALEDIKDKADELVELLTKYFEWLKNPPSPKTKQSYIESLIAYGKYVYRSETDTSMALNFEDVPIITRLKVLQRQVAANKRDRSNPSIKYLPWHEVMDVLEKLRFEADIQRISDGNYTKKRRLTAQAKSLQKFILLGFFVLVPPSRQRVLRELELGRTLKYGIFKNGRFTPAKKMTNSREARYYIHLQPSDYKTGDVYGEWLGEFPNTEFSDGSKFYDYLDKWFFCGYQDKNGESRGLREVVANLDAKTVFVNNKGACIAGSNGILTRIKSIFIRWTGLPISPHDLRHLYRTYIDDPATGATEEEKESAAFWMRHSSNMAAKTYSHLNCEQKLRLGAQMAERLNQQLLNGKAVSSQRTNV